jgi:hypothetical protein
MLSTPIDEANSGWKRVGKAYLHGLNTGVHAAAGVGLIMKGGALRIAKGVGWAYTALKAAALAGSEYTAGQMIDNEPLDAFDLGKESIIGMIRIPGSAKGGQYASKYLFTNQNFKFFYENLASSALQSYINQLADQQSGDESNNGGGSSGGGGNSCSTHCTTHCDNYGNCDMSCETTCN